MALRGGDLSARMMKAVAARVEHGGGGGFAFGGCGGFFALDSGLGQREIFFS